MNYPFYLSFIINAILALIAMAFYTLMERKFLGYFQLRKGPNKVMLMGLPQPFADAIKLFAKEKTTPQASNSKLFYLAPAMGLMLTLLLWIIYPHTNTTLYLQFGVLYFLCVSSLNVYVTFLSGWCSNSKYALLGALRGVAQTISYEVSMTLILLCPLSVMMMMDMHLMSTHLYSWIMLMMSPIFMMWYITNLAETNRTPFDLAEGESELVSGFNIEYSSGLFALIFMAEYANILMMSLLTTLFFTGYSPIMTNMFLVTKTMIIATLYLWIRATLPRMRYDMLMNLTWKTFLPITLSLLLLIIAMVLM